MAKDRKPRPQAPRGAFEDLVRVLSACEDPALMEDFLKSLLTEREVADVTLRWELVNLLSQGASQRKIAQDLGLSLCKITRGSKEWKKPASPFRRMMEYRSTTHET